MRYHWGPLLRNGGERRLNVAVTRARHRLTLVSSFSSRDVDPDRVTSAGARLLCEYLEYTDAGGEVSGGPAPQETGLNPFETDVARRLVGLGISVVPRFGVGGYRVDFAAAHPDEPGRMVLAIEADGASYRDSRSARDRDRLRKEHLERLGWTFHRIWSTNWFHDPASEVVKVQEAYQEAVSRAAPPAADVTAGPGPDPGTPAGAGAGAGTGTGTAATPAPDPSPAADPLPLGHPPVLRALPPGRAVAIREPASPLPAPGDADFDRA
jgi:very-short-patch-repair endonuclease